MNDTPDFDARAREIVNGYGYLCADRMNDWNILQFASIVSAALLQAFEEGKLLCQATVTAGGTASSSALPPLQTTAFAEAVLVPVLLEAAKRGLPADVQELLLHGNPDRGVQSGILLHMLRAAQHAGRQIEEPEQRVGDEPDPQVETLA